MVTCNDSIAAAWLFAFSPTICLCMHEQHVVWFSAAISTEVGLKPAGLISSIYACGRHGGLKDIGSSADIFFASNSIWPSRAGLERLRLISTTGGGFLKANDLLNYDIYGAWPSIVAMDELFRRAFSWSLSAISPTHWPFTDSSQFSCRSFRDTPSPSWIGLGWQERNA